ncbi:hypothetical protein KC19_7G069300 [Ceratodon purpureus]|uniref:Uncharacterized protein n=1 Tax=Ceratodon purpureus TaxID=3225 RepID=A0A8T0H740_CERPU|nr:hypothetical protein KC19_7G069300 [Ceratodon purpureus]
MMSFTINLFSSMGVCILASNLTTLFTCNTSKCIIQTQPSITVSSSETGLPVTVCSS